MRLLHTGDWHVGKTIRGRSRLEEFAAALEEVVGIAGQEGVDAVLVAGDLWEQPSPAPEAEEIVFEAFLRLFDLGIPAVVIPGNHDSAVGLGALGKLLRHVGATVVPRVAPPDRGTVIELPAQDGSHAALVACAPFVPERRFGNAARLFESTAEWHQDYAEGMGKVLEAMGAAFRPEHVNVLLAHLYTDGAILANSEREASVAVQYAISPARLPGDASYIALGHVHKPQAVKGSPAPARYAGSLLQLDFGEAGQTKSVSIVDATPGRPSAVREVALSYGRQLVDLAGTFDEVVARAGEVGDAYLRVVLRTDGPVPGIADRVREHLPNAVDVKLEYERREAEVDPLLRSLGPRDQFLAYYGRTHGSKPAPELMEAFDRVHADVTGEA